MKFLWTTFNVKDLDETLGFFKAVCGAEPVKRFPAGPDREIAFIVEGETKIEFIADRAKTPEKISGVSIGIAVDDAEAKKIELEQAGFTATPVISPNPDLRFFFVKDPNGINVQFVEQK